MQSVMLSVGMTFGYAAGHWMPNWRTVAWSATSFPITAVIGAAAFPETPYWLVEKDRVKDAR